MGVSIADVIEGVGTGTLLPWSVTGVDDVELSDVVFYEATETFDAGPGDLLLVVGLSPHELEAVLEQAAEFGVAGVITRQPTAARDDLVRAARRTGVPLLALSPSVRWARLTSQLRTVLSTAGAPLDPDRSDRLHQDLVSVANTLAAAVGGSVMIFNPQQELLAASRLGPGDDVVRHQAVFDQHGPPVYRERLREIGVYQELWQGESVVEVGAIPELGAGRRQAIAIRAGEEILGSIWVAEGSQPLADDSAVTLESAARTAGGHLVWLHAQAQSGRRFVEDIAQELLAGNADVAAAASWLRVGADRPCGVIAIALPDARHADDRRMADLLTVHFSAYRHKVIPVVSNGRIDLVVCDLQGGELSLDVARDLVTRAGVALSLPVFAVVGPVVDSLGQLAQSHAQTDVALRVLRRGGAAQTRVAGIDELLPAIQIEHVAHAIAARPEFERGCIPTLCDWDRDHQTSLAETIGAWLDAFGNIALAGKLLHIHPNTVRYRVRRAVEICGIDLDDPDARLMAALQLRTAGLSGTSRI